MFPTATKSWTAPVKRVYAKVQRECEAHATRPTPQPRWLNPELSIGPREADLGSRKCWQVTGPALDAWHQIHPRIKAHFEKHCEPMSTASILWIIRMIGECPETSTPTIIFCCEVKAHRTAARKTIKESDILDNFPGIDLAHLPRPPASTAGSKFILMSARTTFTTEHVQPLASSLFVRNTSIASNRTPNQHDMTGVYYEHGADNSNRRHDRQSEYADLQLRIPDALDDTSSVVTEETSSNTIGVFAAHGSSEEINSGHELQVAIFGQNDVTHMSTTTAGGAISLHGRLFLMTAAHPFSDALASAIATSEKEVELEYSDSGDETLDQLVGIGRQRSKGRLDESLSPMDSHSRFDANSTTAMQNFSKTSNDTDSQPNKPYEVNERAPAIGTIIGKLWRPSVEASLSELDYALVEMVEGIIYKGEQVKIDSESRVTPSFTSQAQFRRLEQTLVMTKVASIHGEILEGEIDPVPAFLQSPYSKGHQEVYQVKFEQALRKGDCGSWVTDAKTGLLHGHIIAGSPEDGLAYIVPFYQVFNDMRCLVDPLQKPATLSLPRSLLIPSISDDVPTAHLTGSNTINTPIVHRNRTSSHGSFSESGRYGGVARVWESSNPNINLLLSNPTMDETISRLEGSRHIHSRNSTLQQRPISAEIPSRNQFKDRQVRDSRPLGRSNLRNLERTRSAESTLRMFIDEEQRNGPYNNISHLSRRSYRAPNTPPIHRISRMDEGDDDDDCHSDDTPY